jgi:hypothetical protein
LPGDWPAATTTETSHVSSAARPWQSCVPNLRSDGRYCVSDQSASNGSTKVPSSNRNVKAPV